jgi:PAS domain S-box-containing protein
MAVGRRDPKGSSVKQGTVELVEQLPAAASSAARARAIVRRALAGTDTPDVVDAAQLAVSEVITNALVHAGTVIHLRVRLDGTLFRVEVADGSPHFPSPRDYTSLAGTGRGLTLLDDSVDRWGVHTRGDGKVVWFEIRTDGAASDTARAAEPRTGRAERVPDDGDVTVRVELLNVPLLMHAAWQEHAAALLRDYLLVQLHHDPLALERHAEASDALTVLHDQLPAPHLDDVPEAIMATALEPHVSLEAATLTVPRLSVTHFQTLDDLLDQAVAAADAGRLLVPVTQPEVQEMRTWLCQQVHDQSVDGAAPVPWAARTDIWQPVRVADVPDWDAQDVSGSPVALLATDESSVVVAVSPATLALLGFQDADELVGRRVITIIPPRFRQAHIAGTTLHVVNGRSPLLGVRVTVPVLLADGSERMVELLIEPRREASGRKGFIAEFFPLQDVDAG